MIKLTLDWLRGKKTYLVAASLVLAGVVQIIDGDTQGGIETILQALGLSTLRAGVAKVEL